MAETQEKKKDAGYRAAVRGAKGVLRILIYICLALFLIFLGRQAYTVAYQVFNQQPVETGEGREITVTVTDDMSVMDVGKMLRERGLIETSPLVFWFQELLSEYHNDILPGEYVLNTNQTVDEMLPVLAQEDTEGEEES
ncbi:MAG TPA: solute-binding protein [Candidatus Scatomonas merdigallinarum]|nr:solute-binding protein [Candidatus Scatomonas merdigallinarum]